MSNFPLSESLHAERFPHTMQSSVDFTWSCQSEERADWFVSLLFDNVHVRRYQVYLCINIGKEWCVNLQWTRNDEEIRDNLCRKHSKILLVVAGGSLEGVGTVFYIFLTRHRISHKVAVCTYTAEKSHKELCLQHRL